MSDEQKTEDIVDDSREAAWAETAWGLLDGRLGAYLSREDPASMADAELGRAQISPRYPSHVAEVIRHDPGPPDMLIDGWLARGLLHWVFAPPESAKTWLALVLALRVMDEGGRVAWFDEELGELELGRRLRSLGADPDVVEERFAHIAFGAWSATEADIRSHHHLLAALDPELAVYDTATDFLASAGLDENSGIDVTRWVKAYPEEAVRLGVTPLVLDHTGVRDFDRVVGSRGKAAKAKVQWKMRTSKPFDATTVGRVKIERAKNTVGADLPVKRVFEVGGGNFEPGAFVWREVSTITEQHEEHRERVSHSRKIERALYDADHQEGLSANQVLDRVGGNRNEMLELLKKLARSQVYPHVEAFGHGRYDRYRYVGDAPPADGDEPAEPAESKADQVWRN